MSPESKLLEQITALAKRRGFIYPTSEIYGGLAGFYDYGPLGLALKDNIKNLWWRMFVESREEVYGLDSAIILHPRTWLASGHVGGFTDQQFNLMFPTVVGAGNEAITGYLRPETAQGIFTNFKNVVDSFHPKLPFGIAQIGKVFRNEIAPRDWLFRLREFEQMELEYFVRPADWQKYFAEWQAVMRRWLAAIGLKPEWLHELEVPAGERAHYSERTIDFEFDFPFGRKELYGLAYRTDFDLRRQQEFSKRDLTYFDEGTKERFLPHVIEPSLGVDRTVLAVLCSAYTEDELGGETRVLLKLPPALAPIKVAVFPLLKNKPDLVAKAREVYAQLKVYPSDRWASPHKLTAIFDDNGNIGKRYRRQDEIGTPWCVTVDFETLEKDTVTLRERDSGEQERFSTSDLSSILNQKLSVESRLDL